MGGTVHAIWAVNANWNDDGWNVNANSVENPNRWNAGNQVLSRYYFLSQLFSKEGWVFATIPIFQPLMIFPISLTSDPRKPN